MPGSVKLEYFPTIKLSEDEVAMIAKLANASVLENEDALVALGEFNIYIKLSDDLKKSESERIEKEIKFLNAEISRAKAMLANEKFVSKAPESKILEEKTKLKNFENRLEELTKNNK